GDDANARPAAGGGQRGGGMAEDLERIVSELDLNPEQRAAFDAALAAQRERQEAGRRQAGSGQQRGGNAGGPPGMVVMRAGGGDAALQAQMRQRIIERMQQDYA